MLKRNPGLKLHKYFHHLNSSQAFAFNLFVPYFDRGSNAAQILLGALGQDARLLEWSLESIPDTQEQTNIDVTWKTDDGLTTLCEVKLSESELGIAKSNRIRDRKLSEIYRPALLPHVAEELLEPKAFFNAYQFLRNVWHLVQGEKSRLIFLVPQSNDKVWNRLQELVPFVSEVSRRRISIVSMEGLIQQLMRIETDLELREHAANLHQKYAI